MNRFALLVLCCVGLAGCDESVEIQPVPPGSPVAKPVYKAGFNRARVKGSTRIRVHAVAKGAEVIGADCVLDTPEFQLRVSTPQVAVLPKIKAKPGLITINCAHQGLKGSEIGEPQLSVFRVKTDSNIALPAVLDMGASLDDFINDHFRQQAV
ncbi:MAG: hypothetical protein AB8B51_09775 [Sedimentitalea sp.]